METNKTARTYRALGDKTDAQAVAAGLWYHPLPEVQGIEYVCSVGVEPRHWDIAHAIGTARTLIKKARGRSAHEDRKEDDERIDTEGALAEVLAAFLLEKAGAKVASLVAHKPDSGGVDIEFGLKKFDVKSIGQGRTFVNINCRQHVDKGAHAYVLVHLVSATVADFYVVRADAVSGWKQNTFYRGVPQDPRRWYYSAKLPCGQLEALPEEAEA